MKEYKFIMAEDDNTTVVILSHSIEEVENDTDNALIALKSFVEANCVKTFVGVMYVPYDFYFDDNGAAGFCGPETDHPYYDQERFKAAMDKFTADTLDERGREAPLEAWVNVGGTYCCAPSWRENPYYTGTPQPQPGLTLH